MGPFDTDWSTIFPEKCLSDLAPRIGKTIYGPEETLYFARELPKSRVLYFVSESKPKYFALAPVAIIKLSQDHSLFPVKILFLGVRLV